MVCLTEFPVQQDLSVLKQFYNKTDSVNITPHVTKLLVDNSVFYINSVILSLWSDSFSVLRDENDEIFMEGFLGKSEVVKECLELLHGHDIDISFSNVQIILKFGLLYNIDKIINLAENWIKNRLENPEGKGCDIAGNVFVTILKIGLKIEKFFPQYEFVLKLCLEFYASNPDNCVNSLQDKFTVISKGLVNFLFKSQTALKYTLKFLDMITKSDGNDAVILEVLENFVQNSDNQLINKVSSEFMNLLDSFVNMELSVELQKKLLCLQSTCLKKVFTASTSYSNSIHDKVTMNVLNKPWRNLKTVKELISFRKSHFLLSEYTYIEIMVDWLRYNQNYVQLTKSDQLNLLNSIQKSSLNIDFIQDKVNSFKEWGMPNNHFVFNKRSTEYPETEFILFKSTKSVLSQIKTDGFCNIKFPKLNISSGEYWCSKVSLQDNENCTCISVSLVPEIPGNKSSQIKTQIDTIEYVHSEVDCPVPTSIKWFIKFITNVEKGEYVSSELFTFHEIEHLIKNDQIFQVEILMFYDLEEK